MPQSQSSGSPSEKTVRCLEFFSGIGSFSQVVRSIPGLSVAAAFDQCAEANLAFALNFALRPSTKNLDSINAADIPDAELWWLSPPCQPYTTRGNSKGLDDPRAKSLVHLLELMPGKAPQVVLVENVMGFKGSRAEALVFETLRSMGLVSKGFDLCPSQFGAPVRRPRRFIAGRSPDLDLAFLDYLRDAGEPVSASLKDYLEDSQESSQESSGCKFPEEVFLSPAVLARYGSGQSILSPSSEKPAQAICFTRGYGRSMRAAGSYLEAPGGRVRRFLPQEILRLHGFPSDYKLPAELDMMAQWRLAGNTVDNRCIRFLLSELSGL